MKWLAIINPRSGWKKTQSQIDHIVSQLHDVISTYTLTEYPGHAQELARASSDVDGIVVVGGDGTLFEVLQGMDVQRQHLAIMPAGTENALARGLGIRTLEDGIEALHDRNFTSIDLLHATFSASDGSTQQCYAAGSICLGYLANMARIGNLYFKPFGKLCYYIAGNIVLFRNPHFAVQLGPHAGHTERRLLTGLLVNNPPYLADFMYSPEVSLDDGYFEVIEMRGGSFQQTLYNISVLLKSNRYAPGILWRTASLHVVLEEPRYLMLDGEMFPHIIQVDIQIVPQILACCSKI